MLAWIFLWGLYTGLFFIVEDERGEGVLVTGQGKKKMVRDGGGGYSIQSSLF